MKKTILLFLTLMTVGTFLTASPLSQYKQMGSVAGLAEACFKSTKIKDKFGSALQAAQLDQSVVTTIIGAYNQGYQGAILQMKVWNVTKDSWNGTSFSCAKEQDKKMIQNFETSLLQTL